MIKFYCWSRKTRRFKLFLWCFYFIELCGDIASRSVISVGRKYTRSCLESWMTWAAIGGCRSVKSPEVVSTGIAGDTLCWASGSHCKASPHSRKLLPQSTARSSDRIPNCHLTIEWDHSDWWHDAWWCKAAGFHSFGRFDRNSPSLDSLSCCCCCYCSCLHCISFWSSCQLWVSEIVWIVQCFLHHAPL